MRTLIHLTFSLTLLFSHLAPSTAFKSRLTTSEVRDAALSLTEELYQWPISAESPTPLCELWYHERLADALCSSAGRKNCAITGECSDNEIVRVGIMDEEGVFRGVATTGVCIPPSRRSWMGANGI